MYNKISKVAAIRVPTGVLTAKLTKLGLLPQWAVETVDQRPYALIRECTFPDFESTWAFLNRVAMRSHLYGHHPSICTEYNKVKLRLTTHDLDDGNISDIDIKLAKRIESYINLYKCAQGA